jgi:hypothetical protein
MLTTFLLLLLVPCRWYNTAATLISTPTSTCFVATSTQDYGTFLGNASSWTHVSTWSGSYFNLTAPTWYAWANNYACTSALTAVCEVPVAAYACAGYPPPTPPPPSLAPLCECSVAACAA